MSKTGPKVLLVYPPNQLLPIEIPRPDGSLGLLYLAGALRQHRIEVEVIDASVGSKNDTLRETFFRRRVQHNGLTRIGMAQCRLREYIKNENYDIVGISSNFTPQTKMALEVARLAKEANPKIFVAAGGVNARALSRRFLESGFIDAVAMSEAEKTIIDLVRAWQKKTPLSRINAISFKTPDGTYAVNPPKQNEICRSLDTLPFPAWDLLPFSKYDEINSPHGAITPGKPRRYASLMTSRGCPFRCSYCHISEEKNADSASGRIGCLRVKSIKRIMKEVEILKSLGVTHLYLEDDSLLAKKKRAIEIFQHLTGRGLKISNVNGVNLAHFVHSDKSGKMTPDIEYLEIMKQAGFDEIVFPVESANQRIIDKYATGKLNWDRMDVLDLVKIAFSIGITCPINMMIGFPDETEAEMMKSVELAKKLVAAGAPYVTFFIPIPFPGSRLFSLAVEKGHLAPDFDPDRMNWKNAIMQNTIVSPERVIELRDWAWNEVNTEEYKKSRLEREIGVHYYNEID